MNILEKKKVFLTIFSSSHAKLCQNFFLFFFTVADNRQFAIKLTNLGELVAAINITQKKLNFRLKDHKQQLSLSIVVSQQRLQNFLVHSSQSFFRKYLNEIEMHFTREQWLNGTRGLGVRQTR